MIHKMVVVWARGGGKPAGHRWVCTCGTIGRGRYELVATAERAGRAHVNHATKASAA
jgi:hypothetical protein